MGFTFRLKRNFCLNNILKLFLFIVGCGTYTSLRTLIIRTSILLNIALVFYLSIWQPLILTQRNKLYSTKANSKNDKIRRHPLSQHLHSFFGGQDTLTDDHHILPVTTDYNSTQISNSLEYKMYSNLRNCHGKPEKQVYYQKGNFWVIENYIPREKKFTCDQSITYTTHADFTFLDNLDQLTLRWQGPVSVAIYCPGTDFEDTIKSILYLRNCTTERIKIFVSFHLFFHVNHRPKLIPSTEEILSRQIDCKINNITNWNRAMTYRKKRKLLYPVNVARNVARSNSDTFFNLPSDIELYPSLNVIPDFLKMLKKPDVSNTTRPRVYVLPVFEVAGNQKAPNTKQELQSLLRTKKAFLFHRFICPECHTTPKAREWRIAKNNSSGLSVFHIAERKKQFKKWEPIYIGTDMEPIYDERLFWEGKADKMTQMYALCAKDYEFHILDNAFLVHKPGIKKKTYDKERQKQMQKQNFLIFSKIFNEYKILFGLKKDCKI